MAISQGNSGCGVEVDKSDKVAIEGMISYEMEENAHRPDRRQLSNWAYNSGETMAWLLDRAEKAGAQFTTSESTMEFSGGTVSFIKNSFGPKPYTTGDAMQALAAYAETQGAEFFYETPGVQLVKDDSGRVIGVIGQTAEGTYVQFNATKGVIIATGDYQNDLDMCSYYIPDLDNFERKQAGKTGDGHKMVVWAGGKIEDGNHTKMLHDFDAGPSSMADMPFLAVKDDGTRFCDESVPMSLLNNYLRGPKDCGWYSQIFDADYLAATEGWPGKAVDEEAMKNYMPEEEGEKTGVLEYYIRTFKADTLEELAKKLLITDVDAFVATVERYNELCEKGADEDFGKDAQYLIPVVTPPFYGIHRHVRISAITAGVEVNPDQQCLTPEGEIIPGLYAVGNCAGNFYGGVDYPLAIGGLSLGRCYTRATWWARQSPACRAKREK